MAMSNGVTGGVFANLADLQASRPRVKTRLALITGEQYRVEETDEGANLPVNGLFAIPINVSPEHFGAVGDGVNDDTSAVHSAFEFARSRNSVVYLKSKTYRVTSTYEWQSGRFDIVGEGSRESIIFADFGGIAINMNRNDTFFTGGVNWRGFQIRGNEATTGGFHATFLNYSTFTDIQIFDCNGEGLSLTDVQDINLNDVKVFRCGSNADSKPAVLIGNPLTNNEDVNSVKSFDLHIEDFEYVGLRTYKLKNSQFIAPKIHGEKVLTNPSTHWVIEENTGLEVHALQTAFARGRILDITSTTSSQTVSFIGGIFAGLLADTDSAGQIETVKISQFGTNIIKGAYFLNSSHADYNGDIGFYGGNSFGIFENSHANTSLALVSGDGAGKLAGGGGNSSSYTNKQTYYTSSAPFIIENDLQTGAEKMRIGNGIVDVSGQYQVDGVQVMIERQPAISNSVGGDEVTKINQILARLRTHGLIET